MANEQKQDEQEKKVTDDQYIAEWQSMLRIFKGIIKESPKPESVKTELEELIEEAKLTLYLTPAQRNGIVERCQNYLNGTYGRNLSHVA